MCDVPTLILLTILDHFFIFDRCVCKRRFHGEHGSSNSGAELVENQLPGYLCNLGTHRNRKPESVALCLATELSNKHKSEINMKRSKDSTECD